MQPFKRFLPLAAFLLLVVLLVRGLSLDPTELPSARLGNSLPDFNLPVLGESGSVSYTHLTLPTMLWV